MDRELLIEIGVEEVPASWLPSLVLQLAQVTTAQLKTARLDIDAPVESWTTPRRLTVRVGRVAERQTDFEEVLNGPPASTRVGPDGEPTPAAAGFAKRYGVEVGPRSSGARRRKARISRIASVSAARRRWTCWQTSWGAFLRD